MSLINSLSYEAVQKGISNNLTVRMYESREDGDKNGNKEDKKPHVIVNDELEISFTWSCMNGIFYILIGMN